MKAPRSAAIYARISSDVEGSHAGVDRQVKDCRALAASLGWSVGGEYVDNDLSAYTGKRRPDYERMLAHLADGTVDAVLAYHIDRLTRRPIELEQFLGVIDQANVKHVRFVTGDTDIGTGDGLLMARIMAAVAANESASKSRRVRRKLDDVAASGMPHGGSNRPFGFADDKITIRPDEAQVIKTLVTRFLAGESVRSLAAWLDDEGIRTVTGKPWRTPTLRAMLRSGRIAGLREHRGAVVGPAVWQPIISEDDHRRVLAKFGERQASGRRAPQRYFLTGLLRCGRCDNRLFSSARRESSRNGSTVRRYVCLSGPDHGGCGRLTVVADPLERLVADAVLYRLDTPDLADVLAGRTASDERAAALAAAIATDREQLDELAGAYAARDITMREWMTAKKPIEQRLHVAQRQVAVITRTDALTGLVGNGDALRGQWATLNLDRQQAIATAIIDHIAISPGQPGARSLDHSRVNIVWRHL